MTIERLAARYPTLWHMADPRNIPGILERGLLSTSGLLDLLGVPNDVRTALENERRPDDVVFEHPTFGTVVLRDQRPLNVALLEKRLTAGTVADFLGFINGRVFFWPTTERLASMNGAKAYRGRPQLVFVVRTAPLLAAHADRILLSPINSGSTTRFAVQRSISTFQPLPSYEWERRRAVAEVTVTGGVPDIWTHVERLEKWMDGRLVTAFDPPWNTDLVRRFTDSA